MIEAGDRLTRPAPAPIEVSCSGGVNLQECGWSRRREASRSRTSAACVKFSRGSFNAGSLLPCCLRVRRSIRDHDSASPCCAATGSVCQHSRRGTLAARPCGSLQPQPNNLEAILGRIERCGGNGHLLMIQYPPQSHSKPQHHLGPTGEQGRDGDAPVTRASPGKSEEKGSSLGGRSGRRTDRAAPLRVDEGSTRVLGTKNTAS
jgi:hypothetical protein